MSILLKNISQIVNVTRNSRQTYMVDGYDMFCVTGDPDSLTKYAILLDRQGTILSYGEEDVVISPSLDYDSVIDCKGGTILPGFTDAHTYPAWAGNRVNEFVQKVAGASYMELNENGSSGCSSLYTAEQTDQVTEEALYESCLKRLRSMASKGTTTLECKTGYALNWTTEIKILRTLTRLKRELPLDISITYFAASNISQHASPDSVMDDVLTNRLPKLKRAIDVGEIEVDNIDLKCAEGHFGLEESRRILQAGMDMGLKLNFHAEYHTHGSAAELAATLKARAVSHLDEVSPAGVAALAASRTAAILLPTTNLLLRRYPPPAVAIIQAGIPVALGTDFNAKQYCTSMPIVMYLACTTLGLTLEQALTAATINAAYSITMSHRVGSITEGRQGDFVVINTTRWENIIFRLGESHELIEYVIKKGKIIYSKNNGMLAF